MFSQKLLAVFVSHLLAVLVGHLRSFSLLLSAVLEASRCFSWPSRKLLAVVVGHLLNFSLFLSAIFKAFHCLTWLFLLFCSWSFFSQF